jgi:hypothetical protein
MKLLIAALLLATVAHAETIHITSVEDHIRSNNEPSFSTPLHTKRIIGTIGRLKYTMEEAALFAFHFEVGKDYEVVKATDKQVKIRVTDKKGREDTETLQVRSVEETQ